MATIFFNRVRIDNISRPGPDRPGPFTTRPVYGPVAVKREDLRITPVPDFEYLQRQRPTTSITEVAISFCRSSAPLLSVARPAAPLQRSGAVSKGYNFASTWEQNGPLMEQQQAVIISLSRAVAVAERKRFHLLTEFSVILKELDFSHLLEHLRRILRGQASVFDWSNSTSFARTLSPRVLESQTDAKKELEKGLKTACEEFIMSVTKMVMEPMLSFVTKATSVKAALSSGIQDRKPDSVLAKPLKAQAFATPDKVAELIQKVGTATEQDLVAVMSKMKLYLKNPSTQMILFRPIKTNIVEAHLQLQSLIRSEYSAEKLQSINMVSIPDLQAQLDNLL